MSHVISSLADLEDVTLEAYGGYDGQGLPSYGTAVSISAHVRRTDDFIITGSGSKMPTPVTLYVPPGQGTVPGEKDRVTLAEGGEWTVLEVTAPRRLGRARTAAPDHYRCRLGRV